MTKPLNALQVLKDAPPSIFRLPGDGRKASRVSKDRKAFAMEIALFGDGDGTEIYPSYETLMYRLELTRDTVWRRFKELEELRFLETVKRHKYENGPAVRRLRLDVIAAKTEEAEVRNSNQSPRLNGQPKSEIARPEVRNSGSQSPRLQDQKSEIPPDYTSLLDHHEPPQPPVNRGGSGNDQTPTAMLNILVSMLVEKKLPATITKKDKAELTVRFTDPGPEKVITAFRCYVNRDEHLNNSTKLPFTFFLQNFERWVVEGEKNPVEVRRELTKEEIELTIANARKLHMEIWKKPEPEPEPDLEELFGKPTTPDGDSE